MTGTLINVAAVLAGSGIGLALGARLPERLRSMTQSAVGLTVVVIGLGLALRTENAVLMLASLLVGGLIGEWLDIEAALARLGARVQERFGGSSEDNLVRGFLAASLLYCVGPMTILGSFQDGLSGDFSLLATKSALDGVSSVVLAASLGFGVLLSAATVLIYQGSLTLAAEALRPLLGSDTAVLSLQNGVAKEEVLARMLGADRVVAGLSSAFVAIEAPGVIRHSHGGSIVFGEPDGRTTERAARFLEAGRKAGFRIELSADIRRAQWEKYLMILALSGLSALTRRPMGEIRTCPESRRLYRTVFEEVAAVARAEGVDLGDDIVPRTMALGDALRPDSYSSMYHDVTRGRRLELEWLHGHAVRLAARHRILTPALFALYAGLRPAAVAAERGG